MFPQIRLLHFLHHLEAQFLLLSFLEAIEWFSNQSRISVWEKNGATKGFFFSHTCCAIRLLLFWLLLMECQDERCLARISGWIEDDTFFTPLWLHQTHQRRRGAFWGHKMSIFLSFFLLLGPWRERGALLLGSLLGLFSLLLLGIIEKKKKNCMDDGGASPPPDPKWWRDTVFTETFQENKPHKETLFWVRQLPKN